MKFSLTILALITAGLVASPAMAAAAPAAASANAQATAAPARHAHRHHRGWLRMLRHLNLSQAQRTQIQGIIAAYRSAHPKGSPPDPAARRALREKILAVLTPAQRRQLDLELARRHHHRGTSPAAGT